MRVDRANASVRTALLEDAPNRRFVIEWRNVYFFGDLTRRIRFEIILHENGQIVTQYTDVVNDGREQGSSATVGIENEGGTVGFQYALNEPVIANGLAIRYRLLPTVEGVVTDAVDGQPVAGARVRALKAGNLVREVTTGAGGAYQLRLPFGSYTIEVAAENYDGESAVAVLDVEGEAELRDFALDTARVATEPANLEIIAPPRQHRHRQFTLRNTGNVAMDWTLAEAGDISWLAATPTSGSLAPGASQVVAITLNSSGLLPEVYNATLLIGSNSGRRPSLPLPVRLIVPAYQQGLDAAGDASHVDHAEDTWRPDQQFTAGGWGYVGRSNTTRTPDLIAGTDEDILYQSARRGQLEYRFDGVPDGIYQIELLFAEIQNRQSQKRLFDVTIEGSVALLGHDIMAEKGTNTADYHSFFVAVSDGQLNIRLLTRRGFGEPIINAIRVTHRPDR
jgi:hypothetical protein